MSLRAVGLALFLGACAGRRAPAEDTPPAGPRITQERVLIDAETRSVVRSVALSGGEVASVRAAFDSVKHVAVAPKGTDWAVTLYFEDAGALDVMVVSDAGEARRQGEQIAAVIDCPYRAPVETD